jgi:hypothetical protein
MRQTVERLQQADAAASGLDADERLDSERLPSTAFEGRAGNL